MKGQNRVGEQLFGVDEMADICAAEVLASKSVTAVIEGEQIRTVLGVSQI